MMKPFVVSIQGPTASGKSDLAEHLANVFDGEIVSADSMQVYRGMDIGTAKIAPGNRSVPYHCIDIVDPGDTYSAALFQRDARNAIESIASRKRLPLVCGGTGLYVSAALDEMDFAPGNQSGNAIRERDEADALEHGSEKLHELLDQVDAQSAVLIHPNNTRRVIRALEMHERGESYAKRKTAFKSVPEYYPGLRFALDMDRTELYARINKRVDSMLDQGLVDEVSCLLERGLRESLTAPQAIGYKEIVMYLDGDCSIDEAVESIKQSTRRYAKRQLTWLRSKPNLIWIDVSGGLTGHVLDDVEETVRARIESNAS